MLYLLSSYVYYILNLIVLAGPSTWRSTHST